MTYIINPNAKNVWIRDNEDTMDLSPITDASSVYLENGRTLEQELGEGSMVSNVTTVDGAMSKVIDGTYDGAYESLVFKGKSLVNLWKKHDTHNQGNFTLYEDGFMETVPNVLYFDHIQKANVGMIKPNTKYLLIVEVVKNTLPVPILFLSDNRTCFYGNSGVLFGAGGTGVVKKIITSISDLSTTRDDLRWGAYIQFAQDNVSEGERGVVKIRQMLIEYQEGMENWDIPFFEGICDVKMPILRNVGKNLFNGVYSDHYLQGGEETVFRPANGDKKTRGFLVKCKPNTTYTVTRSFISNRFTIGGFPTPPKDNDYYVTYKVTENTFTTDGTNIYVYVYVSNEAEEPKVLLEESQVATPYEDYKTNILRTSEEIVLREVGGVCDTYNPLTGEYTKRIGEKVLCGETVEDWRDFRNTFIEKTETIDVYLINPEQKSNSNLLCDKMRTTSKGAYMNDEEGISCSGGSGLNVWVSISKNKLSTPNKEGFKQWLQSNPLTVQYELAEPVTTIVKPSTMTPFAYQNGHVILESGYEGQSLLPTLEYSTVVNKTGQIQSVTKTIVKQETQITELEKMLVQGIIGMDYNNTLLTLNLEIDEVI